MISRRGTLLCVPLVAALCAPAAFGREGTSRGRDTIRKGRERTSRERDTIANERGSSSGRTVREDVVYSYMHASGMLRSMSQTMRRLKASIVRNDASGRVSISDGNNVVVLCPGMSTVLVNGKPVRNGHFVKANEGGILVPEELLSIVEKSFTRTVIKKLTKIVIDPGHGGKDPGAIGKRGLTEKYVNLAISRRLAKILRTRGLEVVLTRDRDVFLSLDQRVRICNREKPDLFLSVHANAARQRRVVGVETFFIRRTVDDLARARLAVRSGDRDIGGVRLKKGDGYLSLALYHALYDMSRRQSRDIGRKVQNGLAADLRTSNRGLQEASYRVLKGAMCPAILIETGFLSNPTTERKFRNSSYLDSIARAIARGI